jgi:hypothetical protein
MVRTPEKTLEKATAQYKTDRTNPEAVYNFYEAFWDNFRANLVRSGMSLSKRDLELPGLVPESADHVRSLRAESMVISEKDLTVALTPVLSEDLVHRAQQEIPDMSLYLPEVLANQYGLRILDRGLPGMKTWLSKGNNDVINTCVLREQPELAGWMFIESSLIPPYNNMTLKDARKTFATKGRLGQTASIYIAGSAVSKVVEGHYFDEDPYARTRLLGTAIWGTWPSGDGFSSASCYRSGLGIGHVGEGLITDWLKEDARGALIGHRSAELMLKAA